MTSSQLQDMLDKAYKQSGIMDAQRLVDQLHETYRADRALKVELLNSIKEAYCNATNEVDELMFADLLRKGIEEFNKDA